MSETNRYGFLLMFRSNILDGEREASAALMAAGFVSGQPLAWTGSGYVKADAGDVLYFPHVSRDDVLNQSPKIEDTQQAGTPVLAVSAGTVIAKMEGGKSMTVFSLPFKAAPSSGNWTVGDKLYIAADGLWDNQPAGVGDPFYGEVNAIEGDTDDATALVALLTSFPTTVY